MVVCGVMIVGGECGFKVKSVGCYYGSVNL